MHHPTSTQKPGPFTAAVLLALLTLLTGAVAQPAPYVDEATGFQLVAPAGWLHEAGSDDEGDRFVTFTHPSGDAALLVNVSALPASEREVLASGGLAALVALVGEQMSVEWPDASVTDSQVVELGGDEAGLLSFQGEGLVGAILLSVNADATAVTTLTAITALAIVDEVADDLNTAMASFLPPTGDDAAGGRPAVGPTMRVGGLTLSVPSGWSVEERPGLERSILQGRRETVEEGGARVERTVFPDVRSVAAYAPGGAMVIAHAYLPQDLQTSLEARSEALREAFDRQLLDLDWLRTEAGAIAGVEALVTEYLATDRHDGVRYRGRAFVFDGPEGPLLLVLEVPAAEAEHDGATFDTMVAGATLEQPPRPVGPGAVPPDPFVGRFGDGYLTLSIEKDGAVYTGVIAVDGERYPLRASGSGSGLVGTFTSAGNDFTFSATFDRATLVLETGGARYRLQQMDDAP